MSTRNENLVRVRLLKLLTQVLMRTSAVIFEQEEGVVLRAQMGYTTSDPDQPLLNNGDKPPFKLKTMIQVYAGIGISSKSRYEYPSQVVLQRSLNDCRYSAAKSFSGLRTSRSE